MIIKVKYDVSERTTSEKFDVEDLGYYPEEWMELSEDKKREVLMEAVVEQPYWAVDTFTEEE